DERLPRACPGRAWLRPVFLSCGIGGSLGGFLGRSASECGSYVAMTEAHKTRGYRSNSWPMRAQQLKNSTRRIESTGLCRLVPHAQAAPRAYVAGRGLARQRAIRVTRA